MSERVCTGRLRALISMSEEKKPPAMSKVRGDSLSRLLSSPRVSAILEMGKLSTRTRRTLYFTLASNRLIARSEEHTSELQSLMRISYAVFCLKKKKKTKKHNNN